MPTLQLRRTCKDANRLLPIFLRVPILPSGLESQRGALLRVLFFWRCSMSLGAKRVYKVKALANPSRLFGLCFLLGNFCCVVVGRTTTRRYARAIPLSRNG